MQSWIDEVTNVIRCESCSHAAVYDLLNYFKIARLNLRFNIHLSLMPGRILSLDPVLPTIISRGKKLTAIHGENQVRLKAGDDVTTIAGTGVIIRCVANGTPDPKITWYHNSRLCPTRHLSSYSHGVVSFHRAAIQASDKGNYTCVAQNEFGNVSMTSYVDVIGKWAIFYR